MKTVDRNECLGCRRMATCEYIQNGQHFTALVADQQTGKCTAKGNVEEPVNSLKAAEMPDSSLCGRMMRFMEDNEGIVEGTILSRSEGRFRVEWHDGRGITSVSDCSSSIVEIV